MQDTPAPANGTLETAGVGPREHDLFRLLVQGVQEYAIFMLDPSGVIVSWNAGAERIKGYRADEIIGRHFSVFYPPEELAAGKPERELRDAARDGSIEDEGWRVRKDGSRFFASVVITALRDPAGALTGFAKITRDLTEKRRGEEARRGLVLAREAVRTRDEFLAIASHELRTPLTSLQLMVQALARQTHVGEPVTGGIADRLAVIERLVARLSSLVNGLMDVATLAAGQLRLEAAPLDLAAVAREVVERFAPEAHRRGGSIALDAPGPVTGVWDRDRLREAIAALVGNAVKYAGSKPIRVAVGRDAQGAVVSVQDRGPGIAPADQARVFERFERAVPVAHYGGFGVGLWSARQIVGAHGGDIEVRSSPGRGACFVLHVPLRPPP